MKAAQTLLLLPVCLAMAGPPPARGADPETPVVLHPAPAASVTGARADLSVSVSDPDGDSLTVVFHGRPVGGPGPDFTLIGLPDTQHYTSSLIGGHPGIFMAQTRWIAAQRALRNIAFVGHVGDIVQYEDHGGDPSEWVTADSCMRLLEDPVATLRPEGIPFGLVPGNHDITPGGDHVFYDQFFGVGRFQGRAYYGGHHGADNGSWYVLFRASGLDFVVIGIEHSWFPNPSLVQWAAGVLAQYPDRRAIVINHWILDPGPPVAFSLQGQEIYEALKLYPNLILMLSGHYFDEARRSDTFAGRTVHSLMSNYQSRANGGDGWLRIMEFSPARNHVRVRTYSPTRGTFEADPDSSSQFTLPCDLSGGDPGFEPLGTFAKVPSGSTVRLPWTGLATGRQYEWYATVSDGGAPVPGPDAQFVTVEPAGPRVTLLAPNGGEELMVTRMLPIRWETFDLAPSASVDVQLSRNGSEGPWELLASGVANTGSYEWRVTGPASPACRFRVVARDASPAEAADESDTELRIFAPAATSVGDAPGPLAFRAIAPQPTRGPCRVSFTLPAPGPVRLDLLDVAGRRVAVLADGVRPAGPATVTWDGRTGDRPAGAGLYFVRLRFAGRVITRKLIVAR